MTALDKCLQPLTYEVVPTGLNRVSPCLRSLQRQLQALSQDGIVLGIWW